MKKGIEKAILLGLAWTALAGCPAPTAWGPGYEGQDPGSVEEGSTLFEAVDGEPGVVFETNDTAYSGGSGYSFWGLTGESREPFRERAVRLTKYSGNAAAGYGIVICHGTVPGGEETMLAMMINIVREYIVGEVACAQFSTLVPWTTSPYLAYGFNQHNDIRVVRDEVSGEFTLYLNGFEAATFRDDEAPYHTGGEDGFLAVVSPLDRFPETPVRVRFEEL